MTIKINNLKKQNPKLAEEWHPTKNLPLTPEMVSFGSTKKVWWQCCKGHEWQATVNNRSTGYGCPYCAGRLPIKGETDLGTINPRIAAEWHPTKNYPITPADISPSTHKKVWWKCSMGHEWQAAVYSRIDGNGCPICSRRSHSSFPEQTVFFYIKQVYPDAINGYTEIFDKKMELDIFIPSISIGIEYDGIAWHNTETTLRREKKKYAVCKKAEIKLIRLKEKSEDIADGICDEFIILNKEPSYSELDQAIVKLLNLIGADKQIKIDTSADNNTIRAQFKFSLKNRSLATLYPEIAKMWDYSKNAPITPDMVFPSVHDKVWWKCEQGHEWQAAVYSRLNGNGYPYCSGQRILVGYNDLMTTNPKLAEEWHPTKNSPLTPNQVTAGSNKEVWWQCRIGHEWKSTVHARRTGTGCPFCSNKKVLAGYNDLATLRPDIAAEWHPTKNSPLTASMVMPGSGKKAWWLCEEGHEWRVSIINRTRGAGCPTCARKKKANDSGKRKKANVLADTNIELVKEWHSLKNDPLMPYDVTAGSEKKVWWKCYQGHEWQASIKSRSKGTGCPYCSNRKVLAGYNDLATVNSNLANEWHPNKNSPLEPYDVCANSNKKVWWLCKEGHEWQAKIDNRNRGAGCPFCVKLKRKMYNLEPGLYEKR